MGDEQNDYDRISEQLGKIISVVWAASEVTGRENDVAKSMVAPALNGAVRQLQSLQDWVAGLAETHRNTRQ
jgi:hypothetical protein